LQEDLGWFTESANDITGAHDMSSSTQDVLSGKKEERMIMASSTQDVNSGKKEERTMVGKQSWTKSQGNN
jgi:hypothetical protein